MSVRGEASRVVLYEGDNEQLQNNLDITVSS
jgi:hypothetical protein